MSARARDPTRPRGLRADSGLRDGLTMTTTTARPRGTSRGRPGSPARQSKPADQAGKAAFGGRSSREARRFGGRPEERAGEILRPTRVGGGSIEIVDAALSKGLGVVEGGRSGSWTGGLVQAGTVAESRRGWPGRWQGRPRSGLRLRGAAAAGRPPALRAAPADPGMRLGVERTGLQHARRPGLTAQGEGQHQHDRRPGKGE